MSASRSHAGHLDAAGLALRPGWFHLARPGVADLVAHTLSDEIDPARSAAVDLDRGLYMPVPPWEVAVYRITVGGRTQIGLVLELAVADYVAGRIRPHEATRPHAVTALAEHLDRSGVDVAPVTLTHPADREIDRALALVALTPPTLEAVSRDGAEHHVWLVDADRMTPALDRLARTTTLYVVDGHHRCEAGALLASRSPGGGAGPAPEDHLFAFVVAQDQLAVASFHLLVSEVADAPQDIVDAVARRLGVAPTRVDASEVAQTRPGVVAMWCGDRWYRYDTGRTAPTGDASTVHEEVLGPVFGITEPETDQRLVHVAGTLDPLALQTRCPPGTVAFVVHPPPIGSLFAAADLGRTVPAKSSYFHPKVPAGLLVRNRH